MKFTASAALVAALFAAPALAGQANANGGFIRRGTASHKVAARASSSSSAKDSAWTTINGVKYPTELGPDAPAPVITDNWWLDEVQKNDTTIHKFKYSDLPDTTEEGQKGTNICKKGDTDNSMCQTVLLNAADDFCLWAPPEPNTNVSVSEEYEVAWCVKDHGARLIPEGTLTSVHFVKTDRYVQVTGTGDFTKINIAEGDMGGELDPHGATGNGNPIGGLVYTTAWSDDGKKHEQVHEWMSEISATDFCFRGCKGTNATAQMLCTHIYDEMGCGFIMPANYTEGIFESCDGEVALAPGIISTWTFTQGDPVTPSARAAPSSSNCKTYSTIGGDSAASTSSSAAAAASTSSTKKSSGSSSSSDSSSGSGSNAAAAGSGSSGSSSSSSSSSNGNTLQQKSAVTGSSSSTSGAMPVFQGASFLGVAATTSVALLFAAAIAL